MSATRIARIRIQLAANLEVMDATMSDHLVKPTELEDQISERYTLLQELKKLMETKAAEEAAETVRRAQFLQSLRPTVTEAPREEPRDKEGFVRPSVGQGGTQWLVTSGYGPRVAKTFEVTQVSKSGKTIQVRFDQENHFDEWIQPGQSLTLTWRKGPDCWRPQGKTARDTRCYTWQVGKKIHYVDPTASEPR